MCAMPSLSASQSKKNPLWILEAGLWLAQQPEFDKTTNYQKALQQALEQVDVWSSVAPTTIRTGVEELLLTDFPQHGLQWLQETGMLRHVLPEIDATVHLSQEAGRLHKDVWEHTKQVVWQAAKRPLVRWAALFHDIGKVPTRTLLPNGHVHFHGHAEVGAQMFLETSQRLEFDKETHEVLHFLIGHHLRPNQYGPNWNDSAVRRFAKEAGPYLQDLLDLSRADVTSASSYQRQRVQNTLGQLTHRIKDLQEQDAAKPLLPTGLGNAMMQALQIPASPLIGKMKQELEKMIRSGQLDPYQEPTYYLPYVEKLLQQEPSATCC